jgi:hypothetical protein
MQCKGDTRTSWRAVGMVTVGAPYVWGEWAWAPLSAPLHAPSPVSILTAQPHTHLRTLFRVACHFHHVSLLEHVELQRR